LGGNEPIKLVRKEDFMKKKDSNKIKNDNKCLTPVEYCINQLKPLIGGKIISVVHGGDETGNLDEDSYALIVLMMPKRELYKVWIDRDAEGNGPGWVVVEKDLGITYLGNEISVNE
jgi:hypothetical protein